MNLCVVAQAQLERVEAKLKGQFVNRGFEREVALGVPWAAHRSWQWDVQAPLPVGGGDVGAGVRACGRAADRLDARVRDRGAVGRDVLDRDELAVAASAHPDRLHTAGSVADAREHLGAGEDELDWAPNCAGGEDGEDHVLPDEEAGPERAADVGRMDPVRGRLDPEHSGDRRLRVRGPLGRVVHGEGVALPCGNGREQPERVVGVRGGGVRRLVDDVGLSEAGVDVSALRVGVPGGGLELAARVVEVHQEWVAGLVVDLDQACRRCGLVRRRCDDDGDVLSVVVDAVVL